MPTGADSLIVFLSEIHSNIRTFDFFSPFLKTNSMVSQNLFLKIDAFKKNHME